MYKIKSCYFVNQEEFDKKYKEAILNNEDIQFLPTIETMCKCHAFKIDKINDMNYVPTWIMNSILSFMNNNIKCVKQLTHDYMLNVFLFDRDCYIKVFDLPDVNRA